MTEQDDKIYRVDFDTCDEFVAAKPLNWMKHDGCSEACRHVSHWYGVARIDTDDQK